LQVGTNTDITDRNSNGTAKRQEEKDYHPHVVTNIVLLLLPPWIATFLDTNGFASSLRFRVCFVCSNDREEESVISNLVRSEESTKKMTAALANCTFKWSDGRTVETIGAPRIIQHRSSL
jgi:hypothetical protein